MENEKLQENKNLRIELLKSKNKKNISQLFSNSNTIPEFETEFPNKFFFGKQLDSFKVNFKNKKFYKKINLD